MDDRRVTRLARSHPRPAATSLPRRHLAARPGTAGRPRSPNPAFRLGNVARRTRGSGRELHPLRPGAPEAHLCPTLHTAVQLPLAASEFGRSGRLLPTFQAGSRLWPRQLLRGLSRIRLRACLSPRGVPDDRMKGQSCPHREAKLSDWVLPHWPDEKVPNKRDNQFDK